MHGPSYMRADIRLVPGWKTFLCTYRIYSIKRGIREQKRGIHSQRLIEASSDWIVGGAKLKNKYGTTQSKPASEIILLYYNVFQFEVGILHSFVVKIC